MKSHSLLNRAGFVALLVTLMGLAGSQSALGQGAAPASGQALVVPAGMRSRLTPDLRLKALRDRTGLQLSMKSEQAITNGLGYLKRVQEADGAWGTKGKTLYTYWALLAFLGHGDTPASAEHGPVVRRGIDWLVKTGNEFDGNLAARKARTANLMDPYVHSLGTAALAEYYVLTGDAAVLPLLEKAVQQILEAQGEAGGWNQHFDPKLEANLWTTGWALQALHTAEIARVKAREAGAAIDKAMLFLISAQRRGDFVLSNRNPSTWSGIGAYGDTLRPGSKLGVYRSALTNVLIKEYRGYDAEIDLEASYFNNLAAYLQGGAVWLSWNRLLQPQTLAAAQLENGTWPVPRKGTRQLSVLGFGGTDDFLGAQKSIGVDGDIYRTSVCVLLLETPYRFEPPPMR
jgi:hypothetical protein